MQENCNEKDFKRYCKKFLAEECEKKTLKITALTDFDIIGAVKSRGDEYYSSTIKCLAYIDENGEVVENKILFSYYLNNKEPLKYINIKDLTVYRFKCKKVKDKRYYYVLKVKEVKDKRFDAIIKEQLKPITMIVDDVLFTFNRTFCEYEGEFVAGGKKIDVSLGSDAKGLDAKKSTATFKKIKADFDAFYEKVLKNCAKDIVKDANEWRADDDEHEITEEEIIKRISKSSPSFDINDNDYSIYFNDDDMFGGHTIIYNGNIRSEIFSIDIAG